MKSRVIAPPGGDMPACRPFHSNKLQYTGFIMKRDVVTCGRVSPYAAAGIELSVNNPTIQSKVYFEEKPFLFV